MKARKQGIILLITLFFISAISVLILQNLNDSESFINEISYDTQLTQLKITNTNVRDEIIGMVNKNKEDIKDVIDSGNELFPFMFPLSFGNVDVVVELDLYNNTNYDDDECNINKIKSREDLRNDCIDDVFINVENKYTFIDMLIEKRKDSNITNEAQLLYFIDEYKNEVNDDKIDSVKDQFTYLVYDANETNSTELYLECDYVINLDNNVSAKSTFVFQLGSTSYKQSNFILQE